MGAVTWRSIREISIASGRSFCDSCRKKIAWYDNIPVLSYFLLRGQCRNCKKRISVRYPITEASFAICFLLIGIFINTINGNLIFVPSSIFGLVYILSVFSLIVGILITDLEHQIIPDSYTFILFGLSFFMLLIFGKDLIFEHLLSAFLAGSIT